MSDLINQLSGIQAVVLLLGAVAAHAAVFLLARRVNPLYMLAAVVLLLAPFSSAPDLAAGVAIKWIRGYALVMLILVGIFRYRIGPLGTATKVWLAFSAAYILAGVWSGLPHMALRYKIQLAPVLAAGVLLAYGARDRNDLMGGLRFLGIAAGVLGLTILGSFVASPEKIVQLGRINLLGVLPTRMASNVAPLLLVCTFLALNERSSFWKAVAYGCSGVLASVIVITGTRAAAAAVILAFLIQLLPLITQRFRVLMVPVFVVVVGFLIISLIGGEVDTGRVLSLRNTRAGIWSTALQYMLAKPVIGWGWMYWPDKLSTQNMHNVFLQVGVEMGILGLAAFCVCLGIVGYHGARTYRYLRRQRALSDVGLLALSLMVAALAHGIGEASLTAPSSFAMMMAFGVGMVDCLPRLAIRQRSYAARAVRYERTRRTLPGSPGFGTPRPAS